MCYHRPFFTESLRSEGSVGIRNLRSWLAALAFSTVAPAGAASDYGYLPTGSAGRVQPSPTLLRKSRIEILNDKEQVSEFASAGGTVIKIEKAICGQESRSAGPNSDCELQSITPLGTYTRLHVQESGRVTYVAPSGNRYAVSGLGKAEIQVLLTFGRALERFGEMCAGLILLNEGQGLTLKIRGLMASKDCLR